MKTGDGSITGVEQGSTLPQPAGWAHSSPSVWSFIQLGFLAVLAFIGILGSLWKLLSGETTTGVLLAASAIAVAHFLGLGISAWWTPRLARRSPMLITTAEGDRGVGFTYSLWPYYWASSVLLLTVFGLVGVATLAAVTATILGFLMAAILIALAGIIGWLLLTLLRLAPGRVVATPFGIHHRSLTTAYFVPWEAIVEVRAIQARSPFIVVKAFPSSGARLRRFTGRFGTQEAQFLPFIAIPARWLSVNPTIVYHALSFYQREESARAELGTAKGLNRVEAGIAR